MLRKGDGRLYFFLGMWIVWIRVNFFLLLVSIIFVSEIVRFPLKMILPKFVFRKKKLVLCICLLNQNI